MANGAYGYLGLIAMFRAEEVFEREKDYVIIRYREMVVVIAQGKTLKQMNAALIPVQLMVDSVLGVIGVYVPKRVVVDAKQGAEPAQTLYQPLVDPLVLEHGKKLKSATIIIAQVLTRLIVLS